MMLFWRWLHLPLLLLPSSAPALARCCHPPPPPPPTLFLFSLSSPLSPSPSRSRASHSLRLRAICNAKQPHAFRSSFQWLSGGTSRRWLGESPLTLRAALTANHQCVSTRCYVLLGFSAAGTLIGRCHWSSFFHMHCAPKVDG